jgi:hypothetical protein
MLHCFAPHLAPGVVHHAVRRLQQEAERGTADGRAQACHRAAQARHARCRRGRGVCVGSGGGGRLARRAWLEEVPHASVVSLQ